ncbi:MAG TPA: D-alanine--D-alanine ligase A, partial [Polyangiaceae bacterium]
MVPSEKLRVAVLFGGRSAEHEISLLSARFVVESLDRNKYEPILIGIDKSGRWLLQEEALLLNAARDPRLVKLNQATPGVLLSPYPAGTGQGLQRVDPASGGALGVDVIFPVLHGPMGEDGTVQGLLELSG